MKLRIALVALLPLLAVVALLLTVWLRPAQPITITMGAEEGLNAHGQGRHLYNFFGWGHIGTEQGRLARRMDETASFLVPHAFALGRTLAIDVTMCGCGSPGPARLSINGVPRELELSNEWRTERFVIDYTPSIYHRSLYLEWNSTAAPRPLLHEVTIQPYSPLHRSGYAAAWWLGIAVTLVLAVGRDHTVAVQVGWVALLVASGVVGRLLYAPQLLPFTALVVLGGMTAVTLTGLVPLLWRRVVLWSAALWLLALPQVLGTWILDDAFISFRYARNFVEGYGLTFNPGGEVVEGYTNFLWTLIMSGVLALGFEPVLAAQVLCSGLALVALLLVYRLAEAWWEGAWWALLPAVLLVLNPSFLLYSMRGSGMETALVTVLALAALWLLWRAQSWQSGLLAGLGCALVVLTRPDGALVPLAGGLWLLGQALRREQRRAALWALAGLVGGFVLLYGPYYAWRLSYYGYLLPNTFYAKTGATEAQVLRGAAYTYDFFAALGLRSLLVLLGLSLLGLLRGWVGPPTNNGPAPLLWLFGLLTAAYVTLVGGDHFPLGRFFVPLVPPLVLLITHGAVQAAELAALARARWSGWRRWSGALPGALAALALLLFVWFNLAPLPRLDSRDPAGRIWGEHRVTLKNREMGWWFYFNTPPNTVIATGIAGALPYYAQRHVIDTLGLNDVYIAHLPVASIGQGIAGAEKTDTTYVLDQKPDYIPFATSGPFLELERFQRQYEWLRVRGPEGGELELYRRREE
jgi:hypothetical protein